jgi:lipopolysaccharide/colanic/teichoic acid biosynthesis glycosyltransferase
MTSEPRFDEDSQAIIGSSRPQSRLGYRNPLAAATSLPPGELRRLELLQSLGLVRQSAYLKIKPTFDLLLASLLTVLLFPIVLVIAILVKLTSSGPAFYSQTRLGRLAAPFRIVKFRSMAHNCEKQSGAKWASRNDNRVTPIGKFLRITHLDELPQLLNILQAEMSFVGPRPERPEFISVLEQTVTNYRYRMLVKPGVTGMAQVYLPPDVDLHSVQQKVIYDLYYLRHMTLWLDLQLIVATPLQALGLPCGLVRFLLRLPMPEVIEREAMLPADFAPPIAEVVVPIEAAVEPANANDTSSVEEPAYYPLSDSKFGTSVAV